MGKKLGRPRVPKGKALNPGFSVRLLPAEAKEIREAIQQSGMSQSDWIREALLNAARAQ